MATTVSKRHHVVIIGSGFGGLFAAKEFKNKDVDVTLISSVGHHLFQPLLYQVATGILSVGEIAPATRLILKDQKNCRVVLGTVTDVDVTAQTVTSECFDEATTTSYDSLIVAAGANQSYFGNDHFEKFAPGMKTIDDALELRARILGAFEQAEVTRDPEARRRLLTFVIVGAGPTGVEMAGQVAELATRTLRGSFRHINSADARVVLIDGAPQVLPPFGERLGSKAKGALESIGIEVHLNKMVTNVDEHSITAKSKDGKELTIQADCKIWSAGVQASPLGKLIADQAGASTDRAGRVEVNDDLTVGDLTNVFIVGDMMNLKGLPGVAQVAIQGGQYAARAILKGLEDPSTVTSRATASPFKYFDKGSMATIRQFYAVTKIGKMELAGFVGWLAWLVVHLMYLVGFKNRLGAILSWGLNVLGQQRTQLTTTDHQYHGRAAIETLADIDASQPAVRRSKTRTSTILNQNIEKHTKD